MQLLWSGHLAVMRLLFSLTAWQRFLLCPAIICSMRLHLIATPLYAAEAILLQLSAGVRPGFAPGMANTWREDGGSPCGDPAWPYITCSSEGKVTAM